MIDFANIREILKELQELQMESCLRSFSIDMRTDGKPSVSDNGEFLVVTIFKSRNRLKLFHFYSFFSFKQNEKVFKQLLKYIKK